MKAQLGGPADAGDRPEDLRGPLGELLAAGDLADDCLREENPLAGDRVGRDRPGSPDDSDGRDVAKDSGATGETTGRAAAEVALARTTGSLHAVLAG